MTTKRTPKLNIDRQTIEYLVQYMQDKGVLKFSITTDAISVEFNPYLEVMKRDQAIEIPEEPEARKNFIAEEAKRLLREQEELDAWST